jgi:hypothetical protein
MERKYQVRFHLAKGENYMKWQVKNLSNGEVSFYDPEQYQVVMYDCILKNQKTAAKKINCGANKTVCAWIRAGHVVIRNLGSQSEYPYGITYEVSYNPRVTPFWRNFQGIDVDNTEWGEILTANRKLFINPN